MFRNSFQVHKTPFALLCSSVLKRCKVSKELIYFKVQGGRKRWVKSMSLENWVNSTPHHHKELILFSHYWVVLNAKTACWSTALGVRRKGRMWLAPEENAEELTQVHVVWSLLEPQATAVVQVHGKFRWETLWTRQDHSFLGSWAEITTSFNHLSFRKISFCGFGTGLYWMDRYPPPPPFLAHCEMLSNKKKLNFILNSIILD